MSTSTTVPLTVQLYNFTGQEWPFRVAAYRNDQQIWLTPQLYCPPAIVPWAPYLYVDPQYEMLPQYTYYIATISPGSPVIPWKPEPYSQDLLPFQAEPIWSDRRGMLVFSLMTADALYYQGYWDDYSHQNVSVEDGSVWAVYGGQKWKIADSGAPQPALDGRYALVRAWSGDELDAMPTATTPPCGQNRWADLEVTLPKPDSPVLTVVPPRVP